MQHYLSPLKKIKPTRKFQNSNGTSFAINFAKYFKQRGVLLRQSDIMHTLKRN